MCWFTRFRFRRLRVLTLLSLNSLVQQNDNKVRIIQYSQMLIERQKINLNKLIEDYEFSHLKPSEEVYEIVINENGYFTDLGNGKKRRRIYYHVVYQQHQQTHINQVRNQMKEYRIFEKFSDQIILKQLYAAEFNLPKVMERLQKLQAYHNDPIVTNFTSQTVKYLQLGCIYTYGRDRFFHPIIIIQANKFNYEVSVEEFYNIIYYLMIVVMGQMMVPYHAEKYILIFDLQNMNLSQIPFRKLFQLLGRIGLYYCGNMEKTFVYNTEGLNFLLGLVNKVLPEYAKQKIKFVSGTKTQIQEEINEYINPYQLEEKYGGKLPNLTQYWPPKSPNDNFDNSNTSKSTIYYSLNNDYELFNEEQVCCSCDQFNCNIF